VLPQKRGFWRWTRLNLFDGWQVLGTIGLVAGAFVFSVMLVQARHLPSTGSAFQLVQTLVVSTPTPQPGPEASPESSPSPASVNPVTVVVPKPSASHAVYRRPNPTAVPTSAPTATPSPSPTTTPTPTPSCFSKCLPTSTPTPTPS